MHSEPESPFIRRVQTPPGPLRGQRSVFLVIGFHFRCGSESKLIRRSFYAYRTGVTIIPRVQAPPGLLRGQRSVFLVIGFHSRCGSESTLIRRSFYAYQTGVTIHSTGSSPTWSVKRSEKCLHGDRISFSTWFRIHANQ